MPTPTTRKPVLLRCPVQEGSDRTAALCVPAAGSLRDHGERFFSADPCVCAALSFSAGCPDLLAENLTALGFGQIVSSEPLSGDPSGVGVTFASMRFSRSTLVAVILRGTQGAEWFSNFRIGFGTEHKGFSLAADDAGYRLRGYLRDHVADRDVRFLLTGYSRGGAAANLLARRLCDCFGVDSVRCCTFGSPHTAITDRAASYRPIRNLVRREDFFTRVPLECWGYRRYGDDTVLTGDIRAAYRAITGEEYPGFTDAAAVDAALDAIRALAPNVLAYYRRLYRVGDREMSLYDYMLAVAGFLSDEADENTGEVIFDSLMSDFGDLSAFLCSGMDFAGLISPAEGIPRCSVADSHSPASYLAAMQTAGIIPPGAVAEYGGRCAP